MTMFWHPVFWHHETTFECLIIKSSILSILLATDIPNRTLYTVNNLVINRLLWTSYQLGLGLTKKFSLMISCAWVCFFMFFTQYKLLPWNGNFLPSEGVFWGFKDWHSSCLCYCCISHWRRDKMAANYQTTFSNAFFWMKIYNSLKFVPKGPINNVPALVQIMAWRRSGDKPLSEPMVVSLLAHICVTRPQWDISNNFLYSIWQCPDGFCICCTEHLWTYYSTVPL